MTPEIDLRPRDQHNATLLANVHPQDWANLEPASRYNVVVLGAGTAGLVTAAGSAGLGAKVALVERELMGGDFLNVGCVPSKVLIRAVLDGESEGFLKVHVAAGTDRIVGATLVARHAGEMISEITLAIVGKLGLSTLAKTIHPYPTQAEAIKKVADAYNRTRLTPLVQWLFKKWLAWTR